MDSTPELVIRNAYLPDEADCVDIAIANGSILSITSEFTDCAPSELDAEGNLVSPGLIDVHVHLDMAFSAGNKRQPQYNDGHSGFDEHIEASARFFAGTPVNEIKSHIYDAARLALGNGVLHIRTHCYVDGTVDARIVEAVAQARTELAKVLDIQIVSFAQQGIMRDEGSLAAVRAGLEAGADLVGGLDPMTWNGDRNGTIAAWFDVAEKYDADLDVHIHERDETGMRTLERLAQTACERGYQGRVTASHAFALADVSEERRTEAMAEFERGALNIVTCYQSTPPSMPVHAFEAAGLGMGHGTDQVQTLWGPHGNLDALEAMLVESLKLDGSYSTNDGLASLWNLVTTNAARTLGIESTYRLTPGTPADLVVHDARSPQWAILTQATPRYVLKDGRVVAEDGSVTASDVREIP